MKEKKQDNLGLEDERFQKLTEMFDLDSLLQNKEKDEKENEKKEK